MPRRNKKGDIIESPTFKKVYRLRERPQTSLYTCDLERSQEIENFFTDNKSPDEVTKLSTSLRKKAVVKDTTPVKKTNRRNPKQTPKAVSELNSGIDGLKLKTPSNTPTTRKRTRTAVSNPRRNLQDSFGGVDSTGDKTARTRKAPTRKAKIINEQPRNIESISKVSPIKHRKFQKYKRNQLKIFLKF